MRHQGTGAGGRRDGAGRAGAISKGSVRLEGLRAGLGRLRGSEPRSAAVAGLRRHASYRRRRKPGGTASVSHTPLAVTWKR
ncbi:hypothetical protein GCM10010392_25510 [Streptomyces clavifer]|nr:hypothetical protein GCM10010392_25510 [Streptomyces clavifer]